MVRYGFSRTIGQCKKKDVPSDQILSKWRGKGGSWLVSLSFLPFSLHWYFSVYDNSQSLTLDGNGVSPFRNFEPKEYHLTSIRTDVLIYLLYTLYTKCSGDFVQLKDTEFSFGYSYTSTTILVRSVTLYPVVLISPFCSTRVTGGFTLILKHFLL